MWRQTQFICVSVQDCIEKLFYEKASLRQDRKTPIDGLWFVKSAWPVLRGVFLELLRIFAFITLMGMINDAIEFTENEAFMCRRFDFRVFLNVWRSFHSSYSWLKVVRKRYPVDVSVHLKSGNDCLYVWREINAVNVRHYVTTGNIDCCFQDPRGACGGRISVENTSLSRLGILPICKFPQWLRTKWACHDTGRN